MAEERLPVSVCIVAANEAHRIRGTLESVAGWVSEIVVVLNDNVNDGTDRIAESFGAKVFREPWKGFTGQKNSAADKCAQPWLLNLDADEVITPELAKEIAAAVQQNDAAYSAYQFPRCTFYCGRWIRHGDWYPDRQIRLWRRGQARWGGTDPHATLLANGRTGRLKADMLHHSMEDLNHLVSKTITYTDIFAMQKSEARLRVGLATLWFRPSWRFVRGYFLKLGFLDGWQGFSIAWLGAFYTFLRYAKVREVDSRKKSA